MKPLRVGIIGCGVIATEGHLPAYLAAAKEGGCEIVGVADPMEARARSLGAMAGAPYFTDTKALFDTVSPDVVSIATLPNEHLRLATMAFEAGAHVLCEKPIAMNLEEATAMVNAAEQANRKLSICFEYRTWDESIHVKQLIDTDVLGHVHAIRTWGGEPYGFKPVAGRYKRASAGGGVIAHWTIHNIDLALWLLGFPKAISVASFNEQRMKRYPGALGEHQADIPLSAVDDSIEDYAASFIRLENDTILTVEGNRLQPPLGRPEGWEILGAKAAASICPIQVQIDTGSGWTDQTPSNLAQCDYDMTRLVGDFLRCVQEDRNPPVSSHELLAVQQIIDGLYCSSECQREVVL